MARKTALWAACLCLVLLFTGCMPQGQNITDLLRAPALGQGREEIQKTLSAYLDGEAPQYKFPKEGEWRSPILVTDLDGDGRDEAVVLYSVADTSAMGRAKGTNVWVAVMEQQEGAWVVTQDVRGLAADVASLEVANLLQDDTRQLLIGYATSTFTARTLSLYTYKEGELKAEYQSDYSRYEIGDFTGQERLDMVVVSSDDQVGGLSLQYVSSEMGSFSEAPKERLVLDSNFDSCVGIVPGESRDGGRLIVIDGKTTTNKGDAAGVLASQIFFYSGEHFYSDSGILRGATSRTNPLMISRDVDGDGIVEIPLQVTPNIYTLEGDKRLEYIEWTDFSAEEAQGKWFGILDSDHNVFIRLPSEWRDTITVADGVAAGEWKLQRRRSSAVLLTLRVMEPDGAAPLGAQPVPGAANVFLVLSQAVTSAEQAEIEMVYMGQ